ncbi:MAG TPA: AgmX/PglI C-terminal domain-containing protein, partial [Myxococcota bacterium]|nr:AgmX/PglI C-terminal domain-containing protein [Myxococcota bacterium]
KGNAYSLVVNAAITGKVQTKDGPKDLDDLRKEAVKKGDLWSIPIGEEVKGKVVVGKTSILFQFVPAPPEPMKVAAPADSKASWLDEDDPVFLGLMMVFSFFAGVFMLWVQLTPVQEVDELAMVEAAADLVVDTIAIPPEATEEVVEDQGKVETKKAETKSSKSTDIQPKAASSSRESVASRSLLIQALGAGGAGAGISGLLDDDDASAANLAEAMNGASGVESATAANIGVRGGSGGGGTDARVQVGSATGGGVNQGATKVVLRARTQDGGGDLDVEEGDSGGVLSVIKKNSARITTCTENALKSNDQVKGRISVTWRIEGGKVAGASIVSNQTGDAALGDCVVRAVRAFRFDPSVTATVDQYTWIVSAQ